MIKRKNAFSLPEVLFAAGILVMVTGISVSVLMLISSLLYDGQTESVNRENLSGVVYYLTREIQSAESIKISDDGKKLEIKQRGSGDYNLTYEITAHYPVGYLEFKGKRLLDVDDADSDFSHDGKFISVKLAVYKNNTEIGQNAKNIRFDVFPRCTDALVEVVD